MSSLLSIIFALAFWAGLPAYVLFHEGWVLAGILWFIIIGIVLVSALLAENGVALPMPFYQITTWIDKYSIHDCNNCKCGCGSPCQCRCRCKVQNRRNY